MTVELSMNTEQRFYPRGISPDRSKCLLIHLFSLLVSSDPHRDGSQVKCELSILFIPLSAQTHSGIQQKKKEKKEKPVSVLVFAPSFFFFLLFAQGENDTDGSNNIKQQ